MENGSKIALLSGLVLRFLIINNIQMEFETKNSWNNITFDGWTKRENKEDKIMYHLIPRCQLKRLAAAYTRWAKIYWDRNRETWNMEYAEKCKESAFRHFMQWIDWEIDEDHSSALVWNVFAYEFLKKKHDLSQSDKK